MNRDYLFLKNFYTLLSSGYSVEETLHICKCIDHYPLIDEMLSDLDKGYSLSQMLLNTKLPTTFREYFSFYQNKNCLSEAIEKSLNICLSQEKYMNEMKSQLTYPSILLCFLFLFSIFVVFFLLPNVNQMFDSFQIEKTLLIQIIFSLFAIIPSLIFIGLIVFMIAIMRLIFALKKKSYQTIEKYLKLPFFKNFLQKYFSLKFAIYYQELLEEEMDSARIIALLNEQLTESDLKIVLYEMNSRLQEGEALEDILKDFEYLDQLFLSFFEMYMKNPTQKDSLLQYIDMTYQQIDLWISSFLKYLIPSIYGFVAVFVISIYISIIIPMMNVLGNI